MRVAIAVLLSLAAVAFDQSMAYGLTPDPDYWKQTATNRDTVYRLVYGQSPQTIPSGYDPVQEAEQILRDKQRALPPSNPEAPSLWQQLRGVTARAGVSTPLRTLGTIGLAAGTFELGWQIGSGLNAKFLRIGLPQPPSPGSYNQSSPQITFRPQGSTLGLWQKHEMPYDGWAFSVYSPEASYQRTSEFYVPPTSQPYWCPLNGGPGGPFSAVYVSAGQYQCGGASQLVAYLAPENALTAPGPIEDYVSQPYTRSSPAPAAPPQTTVEQSIDTALGDLGNADLRQWLNYELGSPSEVDPLGIDAPNPDIEFPGFVEHWEEHGGEFTPAYADPVEYWRDAAEIVKRGDNADAGYLKCVRPSDGALIYWDDARRALVIVKDGKIVTYYRPTGDFDYFWSQCNG